jgi:hypothetical protein
MTELYIIADGGAIQDLNSFRKTNGWSSHDVVAIPHNIASAINLPQLKASNSYLSTNLGALEPFHHRIEETWTIMPLPICTVGYARGVQDALLRDRPMVIRMHSYASYLLGQLAGTETSTQITVVLVATDPHYIPCLAHARQVADVRIAWWQTDAKDSHLEHYAAEAQIPFINLETHNTDTDFSGTVSATNRFLG